MTTEIATIATIAVALIGGLAILAASLWAHIGYLNGALDRANSARDAADQHAREYHQQHIADTYAAAGRLNAEAAELRTARKDTP